MAHRIRELVFYLFTLSTLGLPSYAFSEGTEPYQPVPHYVGNVVKKFLQGVSPRSCPSTLSKVLSLPELVKGKLAERLPGTARFASAVKDTRAPLLMRVRPLDHIIDANLQLYSVIKGLPRYRAIDIYLKVANSVEPLTEDEIKRVKVLGLEKDIEFFGQKARANGNTPLSKQQLIQNWGKENWDKIKTAVLRMGPVPWEVISLPIIGSHWFRYWRAKHIRQRIALDPEASLFQHGKWSSFLDDKTFFSQMGMDLTEIEELRVKAKQNPELYKRAVEFNRALRILKWMTAAMVAGYGNVPNYILTSDDNFDLENEDETLKISKYDMNAEVYWLSPGPHVFIRNGPEIYNFGPGEIKRMTLREFEAAIKKSKFELIPNLSENYQIGFGPELSGSMYRRKILTTFKERARLREKLEAAVERGGYPLAIPYNDCAAEVNRILKESLGIEVPEVLDRNTSFTKFHFKAIAESNPNRFGPLIYVPVEGRDAETKILQDTLVGVLENVYYLNNLVTLETIVPMFESLYQEGIKQADKANALRNSREREP